MSSGAADIAAALGKAKREGPNVITCCPLCGRRLSLRDSPSGKLLITCWGGCPSAGVFFELKRLDLLNDKLHRLSAAEINRIAELDAAKRRRETKKALALWDDSVGVVETSADMYLRSRGIDIQSLYLGQDVELALRFHSRCEHTPGIYRPALLARIDHVDYGMVALSRTYLAVDGFGKTTLEPQRKFLGSVAGAAVQFEQPLRGMWLVIGEGIETTLSVMQALQLPGWAALSAYGIKNLKLPPAADCILIAADNDYNGVGQQAAYEAGVRFTREGRRVRIALPPRGYDFNDVLLGKVPDQKISGTEGEA